jgi:hypothetical protein
MRVVLPKIRRPCRDSRFTTGFWRSIRDGLLAGRCAAAWQEAEHDRGCWTSLLMAGRRVGRGGPGDSSRLGDEPVFIAEQAFQSPAGVRRAPGSRDGVSPDHAVVNGFGARRTSRHHWSANDHRAVITAARSADRFRTDRGGSSRRATLYIDGLDCFAKRVHYFERRGPTTRCHCLPFSPARAPSSGTRGPQ